MDRGPPPSLSLVKSGSQNENIFPHSGGEERRKKRENMTIQEAIDKANEGGYHIHGSDGMATSYEGASNAFSAWTRTDNDSSFMVPVEETFLDPRFWQALGRTLGWREGCDLAITCVHASEECQRCRGYSWMYHWHGFIQALADGNTPGAFFAHLTSSQTRSSERKHRHQAGKACPRRACLFLITAATRQRSQHLCEQAARAQQKAHDMGRLYEFARHRRQSNHVERALGRAPWGVQGSTPERV
jgi:hypothetical protein